MFLTALGFVVVAVLAVLLTPLWPEFCDDTVVGRPCDAVRVQTMAGYLLIGLGILTIIFGPIAGSLLDLIINGAKWETPRGRESVITNMPLLVGAIYIASGVVLAATAG